MVRYKRRLYQFHKHLALCHPLGREFSSYNRINFCWGYRVASPISHIYLLAANTMDTCEIAFVVNLIGPVPKQLLQREKHGFNCLESSLETNSTASLALQMWIEEFFFWNKR